MSKNFIKTTYFLLPPLLILAIVLSNRLSTSGLLYQRILFLGFCSLQTSILVYLSYNRAFKSTLRPIEYLILGVFFLTCGILSFFDNVLLLYILPLFFIVLAVLYIFKNKKTI